MGDERVEFGVVYDRRPDELHRGPMTGDETRQWIEDAEADGFRPGAFVMVVRRVGPWEQCRMAKALKEDAGGLDLQTASSPEGDGVMRRLTAEDERHPPGTFSHRFREDHWPQ